jgi:hypothetical protein
MVSRDPLLGRGTRIFNIEFNESIKNLGVGRDPLLGRGTRIFEVEFYESIKI